MIQSHLSPELVKRIDINFVKLTNKRFVTEDLKQMHSDVVYQCNIDNKQGYIYYQIEHQSTPDPKLPLRVLEYNIQLLKQHMNEGHETLPIIINEVIYAGEKSPYPYTTDIIEKRTFDIAQNMLRKNLDLELITDIIGLPLKKINALQAVLN